jgi:hypothetical protein
MFPATKLTGALDQVRSLHQVQQVRLCQCSIQLSQHLPASRRFWLPTNHLLLLLLLLLLRFCRRWSCAQRWCKLEASGGALDAAGC